MWSKLLILVVMAVFLMVVGIPVTAHDGRISNIIDNPGEADEHPWGGEHQATDDPELQVMSYDGTIKVNSRYFFIQLTAQYYWIGISHIIWDRTIIINIGTDDKIIPEDNTNVTNQGVRN